MSSIRLFSASPYRQECAGLHPRHGVWCHITGADLFIDDVQLRLNEIGLAIEQRFFTTRWRALRGTPPASPAVPEPS